MTIRTLITTLSLTVLTSAHAETIVIQDAQLSLIDVVQVPSLEAGVVDSVAIRGGDVVNEGEVLIALDDAIEAAAVEAAEAQFEIALEEGGNDVDIRFARKAAEVAAKEVERSRVADASFPGSVSQTEIEEQELAYQQAVLSGEQAEHQMAVDQLAAKLRKAELTQAELRFRQRTIRSPITGVVSEVFVRAGEWVDLGAPVARVVNLDRLRIVALVPERHLNDLAASQEATLSLRLGQKELTASGRVTFISPEINPVNQEFVIWVDIDNHQRHLRPGLVGTLEITTREAAE